MYKTKEIVESEFDEEFVDKKGKSLQTWELNEKAILNPILVKSHILTVRTDDIEAHIENVGKIFNYPCDCHIEKKLCKHKWSPEFHAIVSYFEGLINQNK